MRRFTRTRGPTVVVALCLLLGGSVPEAVGETIDPDKWEPAESDPRSYAAVEGRFADELAAYDYASIFRQLEQDLREWMPERAPDSIHVRLLRSFKILNARFDDYDAMLARLVLDGGGHPEAAVEEFLEKHSTGYFNPDGNTWFRAPNVVKYEDVGMMEDITSVEDFLYRRDTVARLLVGFADNVRNANFRGIHLAAVRWEHFLDDGKMMYPWEVGLNSVFLRNYDIENPPMHQWILLHPQICASLNTDSFRDLTARDAMCVQVFGHMWYSWKDDENPQHGMRWLGVSAIAVLRDDMGPGAGIALEFGRSTTLGASWHDSDGDDEWFDDNPHLVLSVDLLSFARQEVAAYQSMADGAGERLDALLRR